MPSLIGLVVSAVTIYYASFIYNLVRNWLNARKTGFPFLILPWDQNHPIWMIISVPLRPTLKRYLPRWMYDRATLFIYGWEYHEKLRPFQQYAAPQGSDKSLMLAGCGRLEVYTYDAEIASEILRRTRDFQTFDVSELIMGRFGDNVLTTNGEVWSKHRRMVASAVNERISKVVFNESVHQTKGLLEEVFQGSDGGRAETGKMFDMIKRVAIHVLSGAGLGAPQPWKNEEHEKPRPGFHLTYIQALRQIIDQLVAAAVMPTWFMSCYPKFLPGYDTVRSLSYAVKEFPVHTRDMLDQERQRSAADGGDTRNNIMSMLIRASEEGNDHMTQTRNGQKKAPTLTDEEITGNLYIFTAAGFDTTANTLSFALVQLAQHPEWQEWLFEELDQILPENPDEELDYTTVFPKATRMMALMLETLRLFTPLIHYSKMTRTPQTIQTSKGSYYFPAQTTVYVDSVALHLDAEVFRNLNQSDAQREKGQADDVQDEYVFRPTRWLNPPDSAQPLYQPPKGTFMPWSMGPRVCPGQKMAQVEFVAIFVTLFRSHRLEAVKREVTSDDGLRDETDEEVKARLEQLKKNSISKLTLEMDVYNVKEGSGDAERGLRLRWVKRK